MASRVPEKAMKASSDMGAMPQGYVDMFKTSFELLKAPSEALKYKDKANIKDPIILLAIAGLLAGVISAIVNFGWNLITGNAIGAVMTLVLTPILALIFTPIFAIIFQGIIYLLAKVLGGKATFTEHLYLTTLATVTGSIIISAVSAIPCIGLIAMIGSLYLLYIYIVVVRDVHQTTTLNAAIAVLVPIVVMVILMVLVMAALFAAIFAMAGAGALAGGYTPPTY